MSHGPKRQRPRETYKQTYKAGVFIKQELLPAYFPPIAKDSRIEAVELKAAGRLVWEGRTLEFVDVRIYANPDAPPVIANSPQGATQTRCEACGYTYGSHDANCPVPMGAPT